MNSRLRALGGRINNIRAAELPKEKSRSEIICNVHFLDGSVQSFKVNKQDTGQVLLDMAYNHLGVTEKEYFNLQQSEESIESPRWLESSKPIRKQLKGGFPCTMYFRTEAVCEIFLCVCFFLTAQFGDHNSSVHHSGYLSNYRFIPDQNKDFLTKVESLHEQHSGLKQSEAESCYINIARTLEFYGVELHSGRDLHNLDLMIGIASGGIAVYRKSICTKYIVAFNMLNYRACKNLWKSCVEHHTFFQTKKSLPHERKILSQYWTFGSRNPTKRSPRLRHEIRKPRHSSVDNLTNEIAYITETEDVFYTYKGSPTSKDSDSESSQNRSPWRRNALENSPVQSCSTCTSPIALSQAPNGVGNFSGCYQLDGVDKQFLETYDNVAKGSLTEDSSQYYCDKVNWQKFVRRSLSSLYDKFGSPMIRNVLLKVLDKLKCFSLVVKQADKCIPKLNEGDQIVLINGRDISEHTHDQVVMFIKASRELHTRELTLLVRRKVVKSLVETKSEDEADSQNFLESILPTCSEYGDTLEESMEQLKKGLESGTVLIQFEQLYRKKPGLAVTCAKISQNMDKNRYKDVLPYDATRIILQGNEDYINANYVNMEIPSAGIVNKYIATQGPLPHTCAHFWQVVWDHRLSLIIMLTTLTERGRTKCHQYWPDPPDVMEYGNFRVKCQSEDCTIAYVFREMVITNIETKEEHTITHLQYVAWPDHGVPDDSMDFLEFVTCMRPKRVENEPVLVHCSAGIGRTGVLVTMETAMCLIERNQPVYPLDIVRKMRDQRAMMVQTSSQYKFVCEAILRVYKEGLVRPRDSS
uniref:Protein tyrosine phosphatase non-receptor type 3 n=1 Tax=Pelusios castaneus TaxID=367368 RepID=A0A8C8VF45_9SAUR